MLRKNRLSIVAAGALLGALTLTPQIADAARGGGIRGGAATGISRGGGAHAGGGNFSGATAAT